MLFDSSERRVLVTGASGFVGGRVVETMLLSGRATPISAVRSWSRAARVARFPVEIAVCDILDSEQVERSVEQVQAVVHCASADDRASIIDGTRNLLEASARHGIQRFVYLSTAEVYGTDVRGVVDESQPTPLTGRLYADAKIEAERLCREFSQRGVDTTILRPSLIYGPFGTSWTAQVAKRLLSGNWGLFDELGEGTANLLYVDDLAHAILLALDSRSTGSEDFNINGPDRLTWNEYFQAFNDALELSPLQRISSKRSRLHSALTDRAERMIDMVLDRFEDPLLRIYMRGGWAGQAMKRLKSRLESTPSGTELNDLYSRKAIYVDTKARRQLKYEPRFDIGEGLCLSVQWLRQHELVPPSPRPHRADAMPPADGNQLECAAS